MVHVFLCRIVNFLIGVSGSGIRGNPGLQAIFIFTFSPFYVDACITGALRAYISNNDMMRQLCVVDN